MHDNVFIDTNILVYALISDGSDKHVKAKKYLENISCNIVISTQIMNELYAVLLKYGCSDPWIQEKLKRLCAEVDVVSIALPSIEKAWDIKIKFHYSLWDSLVIASAFETDCSVLCTEDLQHAQWVNNRLRIVNPFQGD